MLIVPPINKVIRKLARANYPKYRREGVVREPVNDPIPGTHRSFAIECISNSMICKAASRWPMWCVESRAEVGK